MSHHRLSQFVRQQAERHLCSFIHSGRGTHSSIVGIITCPPRARAAPDLIIIPAVHPDELGASNQIMTLCTHVGHWPSPHHQISSRE
ncbi:hypothetical protein V6N11_080801 [Hibiscus sabdariffa]|uniref:Uncharacterized protein n=1 Tax=Hibiscus sabdariffa TaxID=183260 RepID=A0ABR2QHZ7_9ROSI